MALFTFLWVGNLRQPAIALYRPGFPRHLGASGSGAAQTRQAAGGRRQAAGLAGSALALLISQRHQLLIAGRARINLLHHAQKIWTTAIGGRVAPIQQNEQPVAGSNSAD